MICLNLLPSIKNIISFLKGKKPIQTSNLYQIVLRVQAKRDSVTRCETRPKLVRNSLRNSSFRLRNIFLREALRSLEPRARSPESGVRSRESRVGSPEPEVPSRDPELIAPLGPTRSVVVEAPLRFLPLSQAVVLSQEMTALPPSACSAWWAVVRRPLASSAILCTTAQKHLLSTVWAVVQPPQQPPLPPSISGGRLYERVFQTDYLYILLFETRVRTTARQK